MLDKLAKIFSVAMHPYLSPIYLVLIMLGTDSVFSLFPSRVKLYLVWVAVLYMLVLPIITRGALHFIGRNRRYHIIRRHAHITSLLASSCCYMLCTLTFMRSPALELFQKMAVVGFIVTIMLLATSKWLRPSAHLAALGAMTTFLLFLNIIGVESFLKYLLAAIIVAGAVASTLLFLGKKSPRELTVGFVEGATACAIAMLLL